LHPQALIARRKPVTEEARLGILIEGLHLWRKLREPSLASLWLAQALRVHPRGVTPELRDEFVRQVELNSSSWDEEVDRRITLRCLLSGASSSPRSKLNPVHKRILFLKLEHPKLSQLEICRKLDAMNERTPGRVPVPAGWGERGHRTWVDALRDPKLAKRVRPYISKVRLPQK
jgi:hypothetical protein